MAHYDPAGLTQEHDDIGLTLKIYSANHPQVRLLVTPAPPVFRNTNSEKLGITGHFSNLITVPISS